MRVHRLHVLAALAVFSLVGRFQRLALLIPIVGWTIACAHLAEPIGVARPPRTTFHAKAKRLNEEARITAYPCFCLVAPWRLCASPLLLFAGVFREHFPFFFARSRSVLSPMYGSCSESRKTPSCSASFPSGGSMQASAPGPERSARIAPHLALSCAKGRDPCCNPSRPRGRSTAGARARRRPAPHR